MLSFGWERRYAHRGGSWVYVLWGSEVEWYDYNSAWQRMDFGGLRLVRRVS